MRIVVMGVAGCGKSTVGAALAARLGGAYIDGDDLHPAANIRRMAAGIPLSDQDRWPWLDRVGATLRQTPAEALRIVGCSALRRVYRDRIRDAAAAPVCFVHLAGRRATIAARLADRTGHFMPATLLDSQFAILEPPGPDEWAVTVDVALPLPDLVSRIAAGLARGIAP